MPSSTYVMSHPISANLIGDGEGYRVARGFIVEYNKPPLEPVWAPNAAAFFDSDIEPKNGKSTSYFVVLDFTILINEGGPIMHEVPHSVQVGISFGRGSTPINSDLFVENFGRRVEEKAGSAKYLNGLRTTVLSDGAYTVNTKSPSGRPVPSAIGIPSEETTVIGDVDTVYDPRGSSIQIAGSKACVMYGNFDDVHKQLAAVANFVKMYLDPKQVDKLKMAGLTAVVDDEMNLEDDPLLTYLSTLILKEVDKNFQSSDIGPNIDMLDLFNLDDETKTKYSFDGINLDPVDVSENLNVVQILTELIQQQGVWNKRGDKKKLKAKLKGTKIRCGNECHALYQLLYFSAEGQDTDLVFLQGHWYRVAQRTLQKTRYFLSRIKLRSPVSLIPFCDEDTRDFKAPRKLGMPEHRYNVRMTHYNTAHGNPSICLDDSKRRYTLAENAPSQLNSSTHIEYCDILCQCNDGERLALVHVKRGGSGAPLSHLLGQLSASVQFMMSLTAEQRQTIADYFVEDMLTSPKQSVYDNKQFVFVAVLVMEKQVDSLASLSLLTQIQLGQTEQLLELSGFNLQLVIVPDYSLVKA